jgi:hypothetical protein
MHKPACLVRPNERPHLLSSPFAASPSPTNLGGSMALWPDLPLVPDEWTDEIGYHQPVVAASTEGFCPKHLVALRSPDAYCPSCHVCIPEVRSE